MSHPDIEFALVSLDPPPHRLDKRIENLQRLELRIPVSKLEKDVYHIRIQLIGD
jgi:hypothetical protein